MEIYDLLTTLRKKNINLMLVTAVAKEGSGPVEVGKKMIVTEDGKSTGTVGGGALEYYAINKAKKLLEQRANLLETYLLDEGKIIPESTTLPMACGGKVTLYYEYNGPKESIYIFGAGHVGQALSNVLKTMPFHVSVIDDRKEVIETFQGADRLVHQSFVGFIEEEGLKPNSFIVVCTPSHKYDYHVINKIIELGIKPKYLGMLCSPEKLEAYLDATYQEHGKEIDLSYFYAPVGLDLGGNSPEEIAISITSEILAVSHGKENHSHMRSVYSGKYRYW
ncbi:MAG: XdhC family protein [Bacilli bacterium]|nr:XdhC family protein [Bacilli bacterium]MBN2877461.1 XdhC family protein [Bacilli bacterium]